MQDLKLSSLQYFVDTIENGSFALAAEKNHVSRPAISQAIRRLEDMTGIQLLNHKRNSLELTESGRDFYLKSKNALERFAEAFEARGTLGTDLKIGCSATLAQFLLLPKIGKLNKKFDHKIHIRIGTSAKVRQLLSDGDISLGFLIDDGETFGFHTVPILKGNFLPYSKSGRFEPPLVATENRPEVVHFKQVLHKNKQIGPWIEIESWGVCLNFVASNFGTCLIPDLIPSKPLKAISIKGFHHPYTVLAIMKDRNLLSQTEQRLLSDLEQDLSR